MKTDTTSKSNTELQLRVTVQLCEGCCGSFVLQMTAVAVLKSRVALQAQDVVVVKTHAGL